ncbi:MULTISPECIES: diacylglycerol/lipid kinase family protein [Streptococcus]|uniref:diacylglycerol/lipid kinase family protein n=1 Tax=Streptococcus TaxID=1301 RepID=UPI000C1CBBF2|nr:diacylglycerol kinase family protein [Streptococcus parauberis]MDT2749491.1 diacylglycerol kinase family lipid kinase [Streptococcus parauberis]PIO78900.1 Diacylglycerol kinase [Streptococcus parauberis]POS68109.1 Diacylglycerol kinase [Streptococcus parauberis]
MTTVAIFFNPNSGKKDDLLASTVKASLITKGISESNITIIIPKSIEELFLLAKAASHNGVDIIIPLGGDGTINKVISGVYEGGAHSRIGLIPSGTVNNFAQALDIPLDYQAAIDNIFDGQIKAVDICKVNNDYMISSLTLGLLADIAANVTSESKRKYGPLAFLKDSLRILRRNRTYSIIINEQNNTYIADLKFLLITMTNTIAGMPSFSPDAAIDDGHFQVYTMKKVSFFKFLRHRNDFYKGDFSRAREIHHFSANELSLEPTNPHRPFNPRTRVDGDKSSRLPIRLTVLQKAIQVIVPK